MAVEIRQVDAFTSVAFGGNPAGVCVLQTEPGGEWMQNVATEMNLSETAFLWPMEGGWRVRYFTPAEEIDLCGHATLASAHILWEEGIAEKSAPVSLQANRDLLTCSPDDDWIRISFPSLPPEPCDMPEGIGDAIGKEPVAAFFNERGCHVFLMPSAACVRDLAPDFGRLARTDAKFCAVTAESDTPEFDFVSRFFAPKAGIDEDPVTGFAHLSLAPFWSDRLGRPRLTAFQASRRGGVIRTAVTEAGVDLSGQAVTTLRGKLLHGPA